MTYKKANTYIGWLVFLIASIVYFITIEDSVSLWDCGEYITAAYKLEVGHPPGAPFFMVIARLFSFFAEPENVAIWINRLSGLCSSATILFMFWSITILVKKMILKRTDVLAVADKIAVFGAGIVGSLSYAFSESFWFSAVEGEVYAMSSLFTAIIFWAILKWDEEMMEVKSGALSRDVSVDRWLLLIMFMLGLAIGVHLLGILIIPTISYIIYFRYKDVIKPLQFFMVGALSLIVLGFIQVGVIQGVVKWASKFEVAFVKSLGLPFYSGSIFFFLMIIGVGIFIIKYARKKGNRILYTSVMGLLFLIIGYGSFAVIVIRSNANTPLDENNPENLVTLHSYLTREQYGSAPILYGPHWNSKENSQDKYKDLSPFYLRRFVVEKNDRVIKAFVSEDRANEFAKKNGGEVSETYFESNENSRKNRIATYAQNSFFPRMYWSSEPHRIAGYKKWSGYSAAENKGTEIGNDGNRLPTMGENLQFFGRYQANWMYWRYFMWNFTGRQNDIQGHGSQMQGNWASGFDFVDEARIGSNNENAPTFTSENPSNNSFFFLPFILGLIGLIFHFYKTPKDGFAVLLVFLFTGLAINIYLNPRPFEPRERDYAYAGSFYFFAMWIGIGVYAIYESFRSFSKKEFKGFGFIALAGLLIALSLDAGNVAYPNLYSWITMVVIAGAGIGLMFALRKVLKKDAQGASIAVVLCLGIPVLMGVQGWDDHDRSLKTSAHDLANNYLNSIGKNGILFTNGDNDTFPLWYLQEVEGKRTDVRVCNLSLMQTDWYTDQMKMQAYESSPLPIKFTEDQILMHAGNTDQVLFMELVNMFFNDTESDVVKEVIRMRYTNNKVVADNKINALTTACIPLLNSVSSSNTRMNDRLNKLRVKFQEQLVEGSEHVGIYNKIQILIEVLKSSQGTVINIEESVAQSIQSQIIEVEKGWESIELKDAMEFVRNDDNIILYNGTNAVRIFPSSTFTLAVNKENVVKSGTISKGLKDQLLDEISFTFTDRGLTREQVMMLDVLANNDWERSIGFSSPGGSSVSMALYRKGYIKQNGMVFELSPLNNMQRFNEEKMYDNLMKNYSFGEMSNPDVLTDYYARRHTSQYRLHFLSLAEDFVNRSMQAQQRNSQRQMMIEAGRNPEDLPVEIKQADIDEWNKKATSLIHRSLEVMPADIVLDYGEPTSNQDPSSAYKLNGQDLPGFNSGVLHDYVEILLLAGDKKGAEELGTEVARQLESVFNYFENSDARITAGSENTKFLYSAIQSYFTITTALNDSELANVDAPIAKQTYAKMNYVFNTIMPQMIDELRTAAVENGEVVRRTRGAGLLATDMFRLEDYREAMMIKFGFKQATQLDAPAINGANPF